MPPTLDLKVQWNAEDDEQVAALSNRFVPVSEIAKRLGKTYKQVVTRRRKLRRDGRIKRLHRAKGMEWTLEDDFRLRALVDDGVSYGLIASRLRRTRNAVIIRLKRLGVSRRRDRLQMTAGEAAKTMGVGCAKTIVSWIERGWLNGHRITNRSGSTWRVDPLDLWSFVEVREAHMAWHPEQITDQELRAYAREIRSSAPTWLTPGETAARLGVERRTVNTYIHRGLLVAVRYGNWFIPDVALDGFVLPCNAPGTCRVRQP